DLTAAARRVAEGGATWVDVITVRDLMEALDEVADADFEVVATAGETKATLFEHRFAPRTVLVLGNERDGVSRAVRAASHQRIAIPGTGQVESLNVSAAAAQESFDVAFKTGPADAILVSGDTALDLRRGDNGSRVARLPAGTHEVHILAGGYITKTVTVDVSGPGLLVEDKLERASSRLRLAAVMPTDRRPKSVEYTPDGKYLVVAPLSGSAVNILDAATGALVASPAPPDKWAKAQGFVESAFPAGRNELWVSQMYTDAIHVFSLSDFSYLRTLKCGGVFPKVLLAHPDGRVFVSNWLSETVSVLDGEGTRLASLKARSIPRGLALSADGSILYVANFGDGTIEVFDAAGYERLDVWYDGSDGEPRGGAKRHLVLDKAAGRLYASDMARGSVFVLDLESGKHVAEIAVGPKVNTIALSP
ncbi:MAG TPA: TrmH family RNA methyltransferase, partial [Spirochaetales bacterium]|nr:TrmH family RNA methyltransferase [Spirochaetales bacterium]